MSKEDHEKSMGKQSIGFVSSTLIGGLCMGTFAYGVANNNPLDISFGAGGLIASLLAAWRCLKIEMFYRELAEATPSDPQKKQAIISKVPELKA